MDELSDSAIAEGEAAAITIRLAATADVVRMVEIAAIKRSLYARFSPLFWKQAKDAAAKQAVYFHSLVERNEQIILVAERQGNIEGFVIASVSPAPPVYDPGGLVCIIDDFAVVRGNQWQTLGCILLREALREAGKRGAVLSVVVCGHLDRPKRAMLRRLGFTLASEWYVSPIT